MAELPLFGLAALCIAAVAIIIVMGPKPESGIDTSEISKEILSRKKENNEKKRIEEEQELLDFSYDLICDRADKEIALHKFYAKYAFVEMLGNGTDNICSICHGSYMAQKYFRYNAECYTNTMEKESKIVAKLLLHLQDTYPNMRFYLHRCEEDEEGLLYIKLYYTTDPETKSIIWAGRNTPKKFNQNASSLIRIGNIYFEKSEFFKSRVMEYMVLFKACS